jgi:phospholipase D1/2
MVIDQKIGFVGGIDLCYGRYDISSHPIFDYSLK